MPFKASAARKPGTTRVWVAPKKGYYRDVPRHYMHHNKPRPKRY